MKYIIAVVQPSRLEAVKEALSNVEVFRLTVSDAQGLGRQKGHTELYRGAEYVVDFLPKAKIEVAVPDDLLERTVEAIIEAGSHDPGAKVGRIEDPAQWTEEKIIERGATIDSDKGPAGDFDD